MTSGSSYTDVFGGQAVRPAQPNYEALTIASDTILVWPLETTQGEPIVAAMIDVTASGAGLSVIMPTGNTGSTGVQTMISNVGGNSFTVTDHAGNQIVTIAIGQSWLIALTDNSTSNGSWRSLQMASTTSSGIAGALAGLGLQAKGSTLQVNWPTVYVSTNTTIGASMRSSAIIWTGGVGTLQLDTIANVGIGFICALSNEGTDLLTVTGSAGETINGVGNLLIEPGNSGFIIGSSTGYNSFGALIGPLGIPNGGTGATTAGQALTNLGGTTVGESIFTAPNVAAVLGILGLTNLTFSESTIATNQVLSSGSKNSAFVATAGLSLTLPLSTLQTLTYLFMVWGQGGAVTLIPQPTDQINGGGVGVNFVIPSGASAMVVTDSNGNWWTMLLAVPYGAFGIHSAAKGHFNIPGGITVQWGSSNSTSSFLTVTYDVPFSSTPYTLVGTAQSLFSATSVFQYGHIDAGEFNFVVLDNANATLTGVGVAWLAIGPT